MDVLLAVVDFKVSEEFAEGVPIVRIPDKSLTYSILHEELDESFLEVFEKLNSLIGLQEIKQKVKEHASYLEFLKIRKC